MEGPVHTSECDPLSRTIKLQSEGSDSPSGRLSHTFGDNERLCGTLKQPSEKVDDACRKEKRLCKQRRVSFRSFLI